MIFFLVRSMDGRPHFLAVVHYQDLWTAALRSRFRRSPRKACTGAIRWTERTAETSADSRSSGCNCNTDSKSSVSDRSDGTGKGEEFEQGLRCGDAENAKARNAASEVQSPKEIKSKEVSYFWERSPVREEDKQVIPALACKRHDEIEDGTGIREQRSDSQAKRRAKQGKAYSTFDNFRTLDGGNLDVTPGDSVDVLQTPAEHATALARKIRAVLGPAGPGLLAVRNVPGVAELRKRLLPLAKRLALMPDHLRRLILKEHDINTDVPLKRPDRTVSAFATQLRYGCHDQTTFESCSVLLDCPENIKREKEERHELPTETANLPSNNQEPRDEELGRTMRQLGTVMVEVGLLVARLCDEVCSGSDLENAILESGTAKGRLIHYHSPCESDYLTSRTSSGPRKKATAKVPKAIQALSNNLKRWDSQEPVLKVPADSEIDQQKSDPWQQWHFDYGLLTVLTSPLYMKWEPSPPGGGTNLMTSTVETTHAGGDHSGLIIMSQGVAQYVTIPPDCLLVQVGEAAQILSGGCLAATAHCVCRAPQADVSRETFVVFLQPAWHKPLSPPSGFDVEKVLNPRNEEPAFRNTDGCRRGSLRDCRCERPQHFEDRVTYEECRRADERGSLHRTQLMHAVPPLASRWSDGCTFAEFSKLTTGQYYGADGRQSQRKAGGSVL